MARIPDTELERLKAEVKIEALATARGLDLSRQGTNLVARCPFHEGDDTPSLHITPSKNLFRCFGCGAGGDVIAWVSKTEGVSFRHAVELLRKHATPSTTAAAPPRLSTVRKLPLLVEPDADDRALMSQVIDYYHRTLVESADALSYLEGRGLRHEEAIAHFRLGFADRTLGYHVPARNRETGGVLRGRLMKLGLVRESGHEHFRGRITVPILDDAGEEVVGVYGRAIAATNQLRPGTPSHLYLPGPHRGVWNAGGLVGSSEAIVCEAILDALTFWCAGFRHVIASYGVEGFTAAHLGALKRAGIRRVLIAYDADDAGERGARALAGELGREGIDCFRVLFPKGMDANEYAQRTQPAAKALELVIGSAVWLGQGPAPAERMRRSECDEPAPAAAAPQKAAREEVPALATEPEPTSFLASPSEPAPAPAARREGEQGVMVAGERSYRVWPLRAVGKGRVRLTCTAAGKEHVDKLDLDAWRQRAAFATAAAHKLGQPEQAMQDELADLQRALVVLVEGEAAATAASRAPAPMTREEEAEALAVLRNPDAPDLLLEAIDQLGMVGEHKNKLLVFFVMLSRLLDRSLGVIVQSTMGAGKSTLIDAVLELVPPEQREQFTALSENALYYMAESTMELRHKVLAISEMTREDPANEALKLLQSEGKLRKAVSMKNPETGRIETRVLCIDGPVATCSTTAREVEEELLGRNFVLTVDEDRAQTRAIQERQRERETLEGLLAQLERDKVLRLWQNAQRLLRPVPVVNPYARTLRFADHATRTRRDHMKYLTLIRTIALFFQYQRELHRVEHGGRSVEYIEVTLDDIALANVLSNHALGCSLDEMPPQTRRLLEHIDGLVDARAEEASLPRAAVRLSRRDIREAMAWSEAQLRLHIDRLVALEYLIVHHGGPGQRFVYELVYERGQATDGRFAPGLIDVASLRDASTLATSQGDRGTSQAPRRHLAEAECGNEPRGFNGLAKTSQIGGGYRGISEAEAAPYANGAAHPVG